MEHNEPPAEVTAGTSERFKRRPLPPDHPDRVTADVGYQESGRAGKSISQRPTPHDVARVRAALIEDIPARVGLTETELRAFVRGELERADLPETAQSRLRELADQVGAWPRKVAVILWGLHCQQRRETTQ